MTQRIAKVRDSLSTARRAGLKITEIIDVGIQDGTPVLMDIFPDLHHNLFEPVAEFFPKIRENYSTISFDLVEAAVSDFDGEQVLQTEKKTRGDAISHSYLVANGSGAAGQRHVRSVRLDSHFARPSPGASYLLKIDVEGPDVPTRILRGSSRVLSDTALVMIEMTVDKFMDRAMILHESGFDLWDLCDLCYYGDCLWQADALFIRREVKAANIALRPMHQRPFQSALWQSGF